MGNLQGPEGMGYTCGGGTVHRGTIDRGFPVYPVYASSCHILS